MITATVDLDATVDSETEDLTPDVERREDLEKELRLVLVVTTLIDLGIDK